MMRDSKKSKEYFESYSLEISSVIHKGFQRLENGLVSEDRISVYKMHLFKKSWQRCIANYSYGVALSNWEKDIKILTSLLPEYWESSQCKIKQRGLGYLNSYYLEYYEIVLQLLSLAILLDIPGLRNKLELIFERDNINDLLLSRLLGISTKQEENYHPDSIILSVYSDLREAVKTTNLEKQISLIGHFLNESFYHKNAGWYNSHNGRHATYYGYWSFESAAIVAIMDIDDRSFRNNQFYPKDLVDYYRFSKGKKDV